MPGSESVTSNPWIEKPPPAPKLYAHSNDLNADARRLAEDGYVLIGQSSFNGAAGRAPESQAIEQSKKVGAAIVLIHTQYSGSVSALATWIGRK